MKTRQSICAKKKRFKTREDALAVAMRAEYPLRPYRCDRCFQFHLTGRTKGRPTPAYELGRSADK